MAPAKILYIDDEAHNLHSFKATFRRQYEVLTAESVQKAKDILSQTEIPVIISDQRMPNTTGVAFFKEIQETYPDSIRILLTGYTDIEALKEAINEGHIYRYITKPWNELELDNCIKNAFDSYQNKIALKQKVLQLQKTNDDLNRFIYSISHELRAPLASARGVIELAKEENMVTPGTDAGEYWMMIDECCERLDYNITQTLQYYRNSRYELINEPVDFAKLIHGLIAMHKRANGITDQINFDVIIKEPAPFFGDTFRIETALGNIISNAIKYQKTDEPSKTVIIDINVSGEEARITITDNGIGIPKSDINKTFTQFFRGKHGVGSGLGLFIAKEALEKIGGVISVSSEEGQGAIFKISIPSAQEVV